ncbi:hypothetical protein CDD83_8266 [Cordyceps sp. RAO-2017]|nr:hypothetical protein CDD83_8266 [Cordyceps sp. RAO-2017]
MLGLFFLLGAAAANPLAGRDAGTALASQNNNHESLYEKCKNAGHNTACVDAIMYLQGSIGRLLYNCQEGNLAAKTPLSVGAPNKIFSPHRFPKGPGCGRIVKDGGHITFKPDEYWPLCQCVLANKNLAQREAEEENPHWYEEAASVADLEELETH